MHTVDTPTIEKIDRQAHDDGVALEYHLYLPENLIFFQGHFPDFPILPGIAQVHWVMKFCKENGIQANFSEVERLKFMRPITPKSSITLTLQHNTATQQLAFTYRCEGHKCSTGRISLTAAHV